MGEFVGRIRSLALALGGPGLFLVAFLDSTFLPLPGITDVLLVVMVTRRESAMPLYVVLTVAGLVAVPGDARDRTQRRRRARQKAFRGRESRACDGVAAAATA